MVRCTVLFYIRMHVHVHERKLSSHLTNISNLLEEKFSLFLDMLNIECRKPNKMDLPFTLSFIWTLEPLPFFQLKSYAYLPGSNIFQI